MKNNRYEIFSSAISQLLKAMQLLKSRKMAQYGLKGTTCMCMIQILRSENGLTAGELAEQGEIDKAQVSRCVSELIEQGYIFRDERDGRRYKQKYRLTECGREVAEDVNRHLYDVQECINKGISEEDLAAFYRVLDAFCANFAEVLQTLDE